MKEVLDSWIWYDYNVYKDIDLDWFKEIFLKDWQNSYWMFYWNNIKKKYQFLDMVKWFTENYIQAKYKSTNNFFKTTKKISYILYITDNNKIWYVYRDIKGWKYICWNNWYYYNWLKIKKINSCLSDINIKISSFKWRIKAYNNLALAIQWNKTVIVKKYTLNDKAK